MNTGMKPFSKPPNFILFHLSTWQGLVHDAWIWHHGQFFVKRNKLTFGTRFGSIEAKTPK